MLFNRAFYELQKNQRKIVDIFLPPAFSMCLGAQKNRLIETVLLSTHTICWYEKYRWGIG